MPASIKIHYNDPTLDAAKVTSRNPHHRIPWTLWRLARRLMAIPEKKWQMGMKQRATSGKKQTHIDSQIKHVADGDKRTSHKSKRSSNSPIQKCGFT